jgi:enoyl-CoA hydratase
MAPRELQALLQLVGRSVTMEILLEGRIFNSEEAYAKGIVNRVVPDHDVEKETYQTVERICDGAPLVARWHKQFADELLAKKKISNKLNNLGYKLWQDQLVV